MQNFALTDHNENIQRLELSPMNSQSGLLQNVVGGADDDSVSDDENKKPDQDPETPADEANEPNLDFAKVAPAAMFVHSVVQLKLSWCKPFI